MNRNRRSTRWRRWELYCLRHGGVPNLRWRSGAHLPNVIKTPFDQLANRINGDPVLREKLAQLVKEVEDPQQVAAGWNAAIKTRDGKGPST